jgi:hypothetical protein
MAELAYKLEAFRAEVHPYDESTGRDIEDLGEGIIVSVWVPDSRREDIDRNATLRAELSQMIDELIATTEG